MATAPSSSDGLSVAGWAAGPAEQATKSDRYLARRLAEASADFKSVAFTTFLLGVSVAAAVWLVCGVVLEHWLVPGGLPVWARWTWLGTGLAALLAAVVRWLVPLLRYRVNLVYAARALESEHPELHNDLVNTVLVKARGDEAAGAILRSLERRTARSLARLPNDGAVDRTLAVRLAVALALVVAVASLYEILAPKSLLQSAARLLAPWAGITAPARVWIEPPLLAWRQPGAGAAVEDDPARRLERSGGAATLVRGRQLVVTSEIRGLAAGERPVVVATTARDDGTIDPAAQPWRVEMKPVAADGRYRAVLPDAGRGLEHGVEFFLAAGDAQSERVRVAVVDTPSLLVREVRYDHPAYTGLGSDTVAWQGDLRAVEGTRVTITAEGNRPLKSAWIDLDCDGRPDKELRVAPHDLARATGTIELRLNADRSGPAHGSYRLVFTPRAAAGVAREETVIEKLEHRIEVLPDLPPEVSIEEPREPVVAVPPAAPVTIRVRALDPDFGLARVTLETRLRAGAPGPVVPLLEAAEQGRGVFTRAVQLVPERLGAGPGSVLEYRAVATDTRPQEPNVQATPWQALKIDPSALPRQPEVPPPAERPQDGRDQAGQQQKPDSGQQGSDEQDGGKQDGGTQDGGKQDGGKQDGGKQDGGAAEKGAGDTSGAKQPGEKAAGAGESKSAGDGSSSGDRPRSAAGREGRGDKQAGDGSQDAAQAESRGRPGGEQQAREQQRGAGQEQGEEAREAGDQRPQAGAREQAGANQGRDQQGPDAQGRDRAADEGPQPGRPKPRETVAADGSNDGEAFERILEQRNQEKSQEEKPSGQRGEQRADRGVDGDQARKDAAQPREPGQQREPQQDAPQQEANGERPQCCDADGKPCGKEGCSSCQGGKSQGGKAGSGTSAGGGSSGGQPGGEGQPRDGQPGQSGQPGQGDQGQQGQNRPGQGQQGQGQQGQTGQPGDGQPGDGQPGGGQPSQQAGGDAQGGGGPAGTQRAEGKAAGSETAGSETAGSETAGSDRKAAPGAGEQAAGTAAAGEAGQPDAGAGGEAAGSTAAGTQGGRDGRPADDGPATPREMEWTDQDLAHARNAADLAIEHLKNSVEEGRTEVLDALGWTPEQARAFLERWRMLRQMAKSDDPRQRGEFEQTLRSLGLRPGGVKTSRDVPADAKGGQAEGRRGRPPASYREQFQAFLRGTGGE